MQIKTFQVLLVLLLAGSISTELYEECKHTDAGNFIPVLDNCSAYIYCNGEASFTDTCPSGAYFDYAEQRCLVDEHFKCYASTLMPASDVNSPTTQTTTTTTVAVDMSHTAENQQSTAPLARPLCKHGSDAYLPHPVRCEYYYHCLRGYLSIERCSFSYGWDYVKQICVPLAEARCYHKEV